MNRKYLMAVFIGLFMLLMSACQKDNPYDSLFHHVEEYRTVFAMTKDEGIAALDLVDYEDKNNTLTLNEELTAEDQKYGQRIRLDNNQLIEGYELVTRLPRSEIDTNKQGELWRPSWDTIALLRKKKRRCLILSMPSMTRLFPSSRRLS